MKNQTSVEYLLLVGGAVLVTLLLFQSLLATAEFLRYSLNKEENVVFTIPTPPPPSIIVDNKPPNVDLTPDIVTLIPPENTAIFKCTAYDSSGISKIVIDSATGDSVTCYSSPCVLIVTVSGIYQTVYPVVCTAWDTYGNKADDISKLTVSKVGGPITPPPSPVPPPKIPP